MRKLHKGHLMKLAIILISILVIIYLPYGLAYTSLWFKPFSYIPPPPPEIITNTDGSIFAATFPEAAIPHPQLTIMAWFEGMVKLTLILSVIIPTGLLAYGIYCLWDWLFPKVDQKDN